MNHTYALGFGVLYPIPSGDVALFLGGELRPRRRRANGVWRTAIGYQGTLSAGIADLAFAESPASRGLAGFLFHRHGLTATGLGGRRGRLFHAIGVAVVFGGPAPIGAEAEARLGHAFAPHGRSRVRAIVGGQLRLGAPGGRVPLPQFGVFVGFTTL